MTKTDSLSDEIKKLVVGLAKDYVKSELKKRALKYGELSFLCLFGIFFIFLGFGFFLESYFNFLPRGFGFILEGFILLILAYIVKKFE